MALAALLALGTSACTTGAPAPGLRVAITESAGDLTFTLEEPIRAVTCSERDHRRDPNARDAARVVWEGRCTGEDCRTSVRYGDPTLTTTTAARRLAPSSPGTCYECAVQGTRGRGFVRFRTNDRGAFEACSPRGGTL